MGGCETSRVPGGRVRVSRLRLVGAEDVEKLLSPSVFDIESHRIREVAFIQFGGERGRILQAVAFRHVEIQAKAVEFIEQLASSRGRRAQEENEYDMHDEEKGDHHPGAERKRV